MDRPGGRRTLPPAGSHAARLGGARHRAASRIAGRARDGSGRHAHGRARECERHVAPGERLQAGPVEPALGAVHAGRQGRARQLRSRSRPAPGDKPSRARQARCELVAEVAGQSASPRRGSHRTPHIPFRPLAGRRRSSSCPSRSPPGEGASATSPARATSVREPAAGRVRGDAARTGRRSPAARRWPASTPSSSASAPSTPTSACAPRTPTLMDYVAGGGTLVVQYNTNNRTGAAARRPSAPGPSRSRQKRVTDENGGGRPSRRRTHPPWTTPNQLRPRTSKAGSRSAAFISPRTGTPRYERCLSR